MVQRYGFDEWGSTFGKRESGVYVDIDDYLTLEQRCRELEAENAELRKRLENLK